MVVTISDRGEIAVLDRVSEGAESVVFTGEWNGEPVAVKRYKIRTMADLTRFKREQGMMAALNHPNVVPALAVKPTPPERMMLMPLASSCLEEEIHERGWRPSWTQTVSTGAQIAAGLNHIHQNGIVHCDLKPANILMAAKNTCAMITDLGISEYIEVLDAERSDRTSLLMGGGKPTGGFHKKRLVGTLQYMGPEVLLKEPPSPASDVYAWAVTVNELATGTIPFSDCTKDNPACHTVLEMGYGQAELAAAVVTEGLRPLLRPDTPLQLKQLLEACWELEPRARPTVEQIMQALQEMDAASLEAAEGTNAAHVNGGAVAGGSVAGAASQLQAPGFLGASNGNGVTRADMECTEPLPEGWSAKANVKAGAYETAGTRGADKMEDRHLVTHAAAGLDGEPLLLGVFDGHRGAEAAEFVAGSLEAALGEAWKEASGPGDALRRAFLAVDSEFVQEQEEHWKERVARMGAAAAGNRVHWPGCTALAALVHGRHLFLANAGDCRAVMCRSGSAIQLSRDHSTADNEERQRIVEAGGSVSWRVDSWRVGEAAIQVTRSIGDYDMRSHGLTPEPEITELQITASDEFVVIASDGLFDVLNNDEIVGLVHDTVKEPSMCGQRLATEALTRGSDDNITVVVAFLQPVSTLESIYSNGRQKYAITPTLYGSRQEILAKYAKSRAADEVQDMCY